MSKENVETLRRVWKDASLSDSPIKVDALDPNSVAVILKSLAPEVEFHEDARFPEADIYRGVESIREYWEGFTGTFDQFVFEVEDLVDLGGDRVLVLLTLTIRGRGSGAAAEERPGWIFTVRDGLTVRIDAVFDRNDALEAAGLSE